MRSELENIARIESYLLRTMPVSERSAFENELTQDTSLRTNLGLQQDIMKGIERVTLHAELAKARFNYRLMKWLPATITIMIIIAAGLIYINASSGEKEQVPIPVIVPAEESTEGIEAAPLDTSTTTNTIIEIEQGENLTQGITVSSDTGIATLIETKEEGQVIPGGNSLFPAIVPDSSGYHNSKDQHASNEAIIQEPQVFIEKNHDEITADRLLQPQIHNLVIAGPGIIMTEGGMMLAYDKDCFIDPNGQPVNEVRIEIREASKVEEILRAGLSTTSGNDVLETAGMFSIYASARGEELSINKNKPLLISMPTNGLRENLKLWHGDLNINNRIDWHHPVPLEQFLSPVDMGVLDFYPENFLARIAGFGFDHKNKTVTDSLYLSFEFSIADTMTTNSAPVVDSSLYSFSLSMVSNTYPSGYGIPPSMVISLFSRKYSSTYIATHEFEARMHYIHRSGRTDVLQAYIDNINCPLYVADSIASELLKSSCATLSKAFGAFEKRRDGAVINENAALTMLMNQLRSKDEIFSTMAERAFNTIEENLRDLASEETAPDPAWILKQHEEQDLQLQAITGNVYAGLGLAYSPITLFSSVRSIPVPMEYRRYETTYSDTDHFSLYHTVRSHVRGPANNTFTLDQTGWQNIASVYSGQLTQQFGNAGDAVTPAVSFENVHITLEDKDSYDDIFIYLVPEDMSSFILLDSLNGGVFTEEIIAGMGYDLLAIAYRGVEIFAELKRNITAGTMHFNALQNVNDSGLQSLMSDYYYMRNDDMRNIQRPVFIQQETILKPGNAAENKKMRSVLERVIYPPDGCTDGNERLLHRNS